MIITYVRKVITAKYKAKEAVYFNTIYNNIDVENSLFANETVLSKNELRKMQRDSLRRKDCIKICFLLWICLLIIIFSVILFTHGEKHTIIYVLCAIWGIKDIVYKYSISSKDAVIGYEFHEQDFNIVLDEYTFEVEYNQIKKIIEYKDAYYMYFKGAGFFISKEGFFIGKQNEWLLHIKRKCDNIIYKKILKEVQRKKGKKMEELEEVVKNLTTDCIKRRIDERGRIVIPANYLRTAFYRVHTVYLYDVGEYVVLSLYNIQGKGVQVQIDDLARIDLNNSKLEWKEQDEVEIWQKDNNIIMTKYSKHCSFCMNRENLLEYREKTICKVCLDKFKELELNK